MTFAVEAHPALTPAQCAEAEALELDVDSANPPALGLYRKFGFTPVFEV